MKEQTGEEETERRRSSCRLSNMSNGLAIFSYWKALARLPTSSRSNSSECRASSNNKHQTPQRNSHHTNRCL
ncbi:hypothetical protein MRB53_016720 [Persea americana]|uniref:Uncharacterized protein n=1 Tax=Persea americana TaxID=3435 RepID=A0ACC2M3X6_PERAE|nr:hypothetical protein MRB53_016720 [Persea americana]